MSCQPPSRLKRMAGWSPWTSAARRLRSAIVFEPVVGRVPAGWRAAVPASIDLLLQGQRRERRSYARHRRGRDGRSADRQAVARCVGGLALVVWPREARKRVLSILPWK